MHSKLPASTTNIFSTMTMLAQQHNAINLGQGFPDYNIEPNLIQLVSQAYTQNNNQYAPMAGYAPLKQQLAHNIKAQYNTTYNPDTEILITPGGTYALYIAITALVHPGDEVIVIEPAYDSYIPNILLNKGIPVIYEMEMPNFAIDWQKLEKLITPKTKLIIINNPHNPTGTVWQPADMLALQNLVSKYGVYILSDEVYEHIHFASTPHQSVLVHEQWQKNVIAVFSFGKVVQATGWKLGYIVAHQTLMQEIIKIHQYIAFTCNTALQVALNQYYAQNHIFTQLKTQLEHKKNLLESYIKQTTLTLIPSQGSYFTSVCYKGLSTLPDTEFAQELVTKAGIATIPYSPFYSSRRNDFLLRFCFAKKDETLHKAGHLLAQYFTTK